MPGLRSILVLEDNADLTGVLCTIFELEGLQVACAADGAAALAYLAEFAPPGLIVLDLRMPVCDGWAFRAAQLADPELAQIPVIVVTGVEPEERRTSELRAQHYLDKPVDLGTLLPLVRGYFVQDRKLVL